MSKVMTWEQIQRDWAGLQKRHRMEIAQAVARYCIGHKMEEVADVLGYGKQWIRTQLDVAGIAGAIGGGAHVDTPLTGSTNNVARNDIPRVVSEFGPSIKVKLDDDGSGNQSIAEITGDDAEEFQPYVDHYVNEGHEPAAATRLAKAEWAAEAAVEAGVIKETKNKRDEKVNQILFPEDEKETFDLDLETHMKRVAAAARFLDKAKMNCLRRKSTCDKVMSANEKWLEQVERVLNLHPTLK